MYYNRIHSSLLMLLLVLALSYSAQAFQSSGHPTQRPDHPSLRSLSQCAQGSYYVDGACTRVCPAKFYGYHSLCWACDSSCQNGLCISNQDCNPCRDGKIYLTESASCVETCPSGYFEDSHNKICLKCAEGCSSCTYPNGLCESSSSNTDLIIYISVPIAILLLAVIGICCWRKTKKPKKKSKSKKSKRQQPTQDEEAQSPSRANKLAQLKRFTGNNGPVGPYNVMPEDFNQDDEAEEEATSPGGRSNKRKLTAQSNKLTLSISKAFQVDDHDEQAVAHAHGSAIFKRSGSVILSSRSGDSPKIKLRKPTKAFSSGVLRVQEAGIRQETLEARPLDLTADGSAAHASYFEMSPAHGLTPKRDNTSLGFMAVKKTDTLESPKGEDLNKVDLERIETGVKETEVDKIEEVEEEEDEEEKKERGYREDSSVNLSTDGKDVASCTLCGMNKIDCTIKPCEHMIGCYACMRLFRQSYGVCPKCKVPIEKLEKVKDRHHAHREALHLEL